MSTEKLSIAAAKSFTNDPLNSFSVEKAPLRKPLAAFRKNVLSQKLWGVRSSVVVDNCKFEAFELSEIEEEWEEDGFNIDK